MPSVCKGTQHCEHVRNSLVLNYKSAALPTELSHIRHPRYLGDVLTLFSLVLFAAFRMPFTYEKSAMTNGQDLSDVLRLGRMWCEGDYECKSADAKC